jgi:hypothetical protein
MCWEQSPGKERLQLPVATTTETDANKQLRQQNTTIHQKQEATTKQRYHCATTPMETILS